MGCLTVPGRDSLQSSLSCSINIPGSLSILCCSSGGAEKSGREDPAGISSSKEVLTCKPPPEAAALPHEACWLNCKKEITDEVAVLPGL